jgi:hypothetical protein
MTPTSNHAPGSFVLEVGLVGHKPESYPFDQRYVIVGRGEHVDLRIEHAAIARAQFVIERGLGSAGEPRFRITPVPTATNPTYVNDQLAVEGALLPGDRVAVGDVRVVLAAPADTRNPAAAATAKAPGSSRLRLVLLGATIGMALVVASLFVGSGGDRTNALATAPATLFATPPDAHCAAPVECATRAHDAYARGKELLAQTAADPGNFYRATLELERAVRFRERSGEPLPDIADVAALAQSARDRAETEFADAEFRLRRAMAAHDPARSAAAAALLVRLVPDENHPYRKQLDAYRRALLPTHKEGLP